jgi:D-aspartate ligase
VPSPSHRPPVLLTALNLNGLGVARALWERGVEVHALHDGPDDAPELETRAVRRVWRRTPGEDLIDFLVRVGPELGKDRPVLMPITDESVERITAAHERLETIYRLPYGDPRAVNELLSKKGIDAAARAHGVPVPATFVVEEPEDLDRVAEQVRYPCILKPQDKSPAFATTGAKKAERLEDAEGLRRAYRAFCDAEPRAVVQEFIPGGDADVHFCLVALGQDGRLLGSFVGHKIRQWPPRCGGTASCGPAHAPELVERTARFLAAAGVRGIASCEYKRDPRDGSFFLIEPTVGRSDWQNAVADINGVPIPYLVYADLVGAPVPEARQRKWARKWVHFTSDLRSADEYRKRGELSRLGWLWSLRPPIRWSYFHGADTGPARAIWAASLRRLARKLGLPTGGGSPTETEERPA